jgi:4-hydroxybenzoate polyprenyltransferase
MAIAARRDLSLSTLLTLGRVSNLPTVWTNVVAGTVLAGGAWQSGRVVVVLLAASLFYLGGMYLNDYFDRAIDARERPGRPIPAGDVSAGVVAAIGSGLLAAGVAVLLPTGFAATVIGLALVGLIVAYDRFHKGNPVSPIVMGACRMLVYLAAAAAITGDVPGSVVSAGLALLAYVAGLTYAARQESLDRVGNLWPLLVLSAPMILATPALAWGFWAVAIYLMLIGWTAFAVYQLARRPAPGAVPRAVGALIAGISLVDAALMASVGAVVPALIAVVGFGATIVLQKFIAGT